MENNKPICASMDSTKSLYIFVIPAPIFEEKTKQKSPLPWSYYSMYSNSIPQFLNYLKRYIMPEALTVLFHLVLLAPFTWKYMQVLQINTVVQNLKTLSKLA